MAIPITQINNNKVCVPSMAVSDERRPASLTPDSQDIKLRDPESPGLVVSNPSGPELQESFPFMTAPGLFLLYYFDNQPISFSLSSNLSKWNKFYRVKQVGTHI